MARSEAPTYGPGTWLTVAGAVLAVHAGLMAALWNNGPTVPRTSTVPEAVQVALLDASTTAEAPPPPLVKPRAQSVATPRPPKPAATPTEAAPASTPEPILALPLPPEAPSLADASTAADTEAGVVTVAQTDTPPGAPTEPDATGPSATAWHPPVSGTWSYDVTGQAKGLNYRAGATMTWAHDGSRYDARIELRALFIGSRVQHSQGQIGPDGLVPERFVDKARKERVLQFDWPQAQLLSQATPAALPPGTQDRLSLFLQLGRALALLPEAPTPGQLWTLPVATTGEVEPWTFAFAGAERLELPAGPHDTWKLERQRRQPGDQRVELWFAPALHHLPVRIRLVQDNGDEVDQRLSGTDRP